MVEGAALEKQCAGNGTEGSNPSLSANIGARHLWRVLILAGQKKLNCFSFVGFEQAERFRQLADSEPCRDAKTNGF